MPEAPAKPTTAQQQDELLLLAEKIGEVSDRLAQIETEFTAQTAPLDSARATQDSALAALNAALAGIKALNFHVLDNNLGAVSRRVETVAAQATKCIEVLDAKFTDFERERERTAKELSEKFNLTEQRRTELAAKREADAQQFARAQESLRHEFFEKISNITADLKRIADATPTAFNPRGDWDAHTNYTKLDVVTLNGTSYVSRESDNTEKPGRGSKRWQVLARRGGAALGGGATDITGLQATLDAKAPLASPALTGTPTAPTAPPGTRTTQLATTDFVAKATMGPPWRSRNPARAANTWDTVGVKQKVSITCLPATGLGGKYVRLGLSRTSGGVLHLGDSDGAAHAVDVWFNLGSDTAPTGTGADRQIEVALDGADTAAQVATKLAAALQADEGCGRADVAGATATVITRLAVAAPAPAAGTSGFTTALLTAGSPVFSGFICFSPGALAPNGKIYAAPARESKVLVIDPETDTYTTIPTRTDGTDADKWGAATCTLNGKIYCLPGKYQSLLVIDPATDTLTEIPCAVTGAIWTQPQLAPNGLIYAGPAEGDTSDTILVIDPATDTYTTIDVSAWASFTDISSTVLAGTGDLWFFKQKANWAFSLNLATGVITAHNWTDYPNSHVERVNACALPDGRIALVATQNSHLIQIIDPATGTIVSTTWLGARESTFDFRDIFLAPNGLIYGLPGDAVSLWVIDPANGTYTKPITGLSGGVKWTHATLAPNGKLYAAPAQARVPLVLDPGPGPLTPMLLSPIFN